MKELIERARNHAERLERGDDFYRDEISETLIAMAGALERAEALREAGHWLASGLHDHIAAGKIQCASCEMQLESWRVADAAYREASR